MKRLDILVFGSDRVLCETRAMLVRRAGYWADCAFNYAGARNVVLSEHPSVVVFCCSLSEADRDELMKLIASYSPDTKSLFVGEPGTARSERTSVDFVESLAGPVRFLARIESLIGS